VIKFNGHRRYFVTTLKSGFEKYIEPYINKKICSMHGCKKPDEVYIDNKYKKIFIIEKKFQQVNGYVCEKIQTAIAKHWYYNKRIPTYEVIYMYCLSDWFKDNCIGELQMLKEFNIPVFFGNDENYKKYIIKFMMNYYKNKT